MDYKKIVNFVPQYYQPNSTYEWIMDDYKEKFENGILNKVNTLDYYLKNPITYSFNNYGFRTPDDFNTADEGNVFLGCSHTFGTGHHLENTWSYKLNQKIGGKFWNMGLSGTGTMSHFRILLGFCKELKIKNIFHYAPKYNRYEFIVNGKTEIYIMARYSEFADSWKKQFGNLLDDCLITDEQAEITYETNIYAIKGLANELGIKYYHYSEIPEIKNDTSIIARDNHHFTTKQQEHIYLEFLKLYGDVELENNNPLKNAKTLL